uniref:Cytochrome c6 n=1 Tax=Chondria tumulosa TaxID=2740715 RepID=A0A896SPP0_9FLOR|nr:cytochrome c553 [Chondria tumulosa]QSD57022.1 cytochrome c553 [Chondria tumulosa]
MKLRFLLSLFLGFLLIFLLNTQLVCSQDLAEGEQLFSANCVACHANGLNSVNPEKTLQIKDLEKYSKDSVDAIVTQVTNGYGAMPPFGDRLSEDEVKNVASYVLNQAVNSSW